MAMIRPTQDPSGYPISEKDLPNMPKEQPRYRHPFRETVRRISLNLWLWELPGLLTSASCVLAILIILGRCNGKPVPTWSYGLTVNGVVSLLAVVAKASLIIPIAEAISQLKWCWYWDRQRPVMDFEIFDGASRGLWGSLVLLCYPRSWNLASLGALLTLAAIVIKPSIQQIPIYPLEQIPSSNASSPRSLYFHEVEHDGAGNAIVGAKLRGAVYSAVFDSLPGRNAGLDPYCPTGNCTWPPFQSLGVCSDCHNITDQLYNRRQGWSLPNDMPFDAPTWSTSLCWMVGGLCESIIFNQALANQSIIDISYIYIPPISSGEKAWNKTHPNAYECALYPRIKTYAASMENGNYIETVTKTWPDPVMNGTVDTYANRTSPCTSRNSSGSVVQNLNCSYIPNGNFTLTSPESGETFRLSLELYTLSRAWLSHRFKLSYVSDYNGLQIAIDPVYNDFALAFYSSQSKEKSSLSNTTEIWDMLGLDVVMDRIALSLTNHMRSAAGHSKAAIGTAATVQAVLRARWWWAACAITLLSVTAAFFLCTVAITMKKKAPIWKSSSLAALLHGLDDSSCKAMTALCFDEVEDKAKPFEMAMKLDDNRWKLEGVGCRQGRVEPR